VAEAADALARASGRIRCDVEDDVVRMSGVSGHAAHSHEMVKVQGMLSASSDIVIRAGRVTADSDSAHDLFAF
jgi:hypothetical protein